MVYSVQNWLGESETQKKNATTPGYFNVAMACTFPYFPLYLSTEFSGLTHSQLSPCSSATSPCSCRPSSPVSPLPPALPPPCPLNKHENIWKRGGRKVKEAQY